MTRRLFAVLVPVVWAMPLFAAQTIVVSSQAPSGGNGSATAPFQSLTQARDAIRDGRKSGRLSPDEPVTVEILPGNYVLNSSFELTAADSGTPEAPVIYRAQTPGTVHIRGGIELDSTQWKNVTDPEVLKRLDSNAIEHIRVFDLKQSVPGEFQPLKTAYSGAPMGPWLYFSEAPMTLARWPNVDAPNSGWATFSKAIDTGLPKPDSPDPALQKLRPGSFEFDDPRPARWKLDEGVWLQGYWTHDWRDEVIRIDTYDPQKQVIRLAAPHYYGIKGNTWGASKRRFYALNLLEELDAPGEWYLDRPNKLLYFYPPSPLSKMPAVLATLTAPLVKAANVKHVTFQQLNFEYCHSTGLVLRNVEGVEIAGCTIANIAHSGISISGQKNIIRSCDLFHLGTSGLSVSGGDRKTLTPAENLIENNHIHHYALFQRTYAAAIHLSGCGQVARNNCIHDAPHNAILYSGNEHLIEKNEAYRVVMETGDAGAFYTGRDWTSQGNVLRFNYIHNLGGGESSHVNTMGIYLDDCDSGDTLQGNIFYRAGRAFLIGGGRDNKIINNVVVDCPIGLHLDSRGMTWKQWNDPANKSWHLEGKAEALNYQQPPWSERYPSLAKIMQDSPQEPLHNDIQRNVFIDCSKEVCHFDNNVLKLLPKLTISDNVALTTTDGQESPRLPQGLQGFQSLNAPQLQSVVREFEKSPPGRLTEQGLRQIQTILPAFENIPVNEIGLYQDKFRTELPQR